MERVGKPSPELPEVQASACAALFCIHLAGRAATVARCDSSGAAGRIRAARGERPLAMPLQKERLDSRQVTGAVAVPAVDDSCKRPLLMGCGMNVPDG